MHFPKNEGIRTVIVVIHLKARIVHIDGNNSRIECRKRENRSIVQIYPAYSIAESSIMNVRSFVFLYDI
jgi:hypothetical protein